MVSFNNGILTIKKSEDGSFFRFLFEICLYLGLVLYNLSFEPLHYIGVAALIAGSGFITVEKLHNSRINFPILSLWYLAFICFAEISTLWAYSPRIAALKYVKFMLLILAFCFGITQYTDTKKDVNRILDIFLYIGLTISLIEFIGTPVVNWSSGYFGTYVGGGNTNTFGYIMMFCAIISFFKAYYYGKRIWYLATLLFLVGCTLSSSRKAVLMSAFGLLFIIFFSFGRKHHFIHFIAAFLAITLLFTLIMSNELLYSIVGNRIDALIAFTSNSGPVKYGSLQLREHYIDFAKQLFRKKPLIGHGFGNFSALHVAEINQTFVYAHNNYWEILSDLGIIGFLLYYWFYVYMLIKLATKFFQKRFTDMKLLAATMLIMEIILEWGVVSMFYPFQQTVIAIIFILINTNDTENEKKFYYTSHKD